ncbi:MAG TPA: serine hydrolase [Rhizomicrobium sp.]|jgi:CubicO group peptidase (beta-lactamase class C family)|nr:serine hydrolase [Rhizomicrobium sp.]
MPASSREAIGQRKSLAQYAQAQKTTGLLIIRDGKTLVEHNWPLPAGSDAFAAVLVRGTADDGALLEDVASQQKSVLAILTGIAMDRGLLDIARPMSDFLGPGWSRADAARERAITVRHLLEMTSGLGEALEFEAPAGTRFFYNTPAYARLHKVLEIAAGRPLDALTRDWLTGPLAMAESGWRPRPAALAHSSGNAWSFVTMPRDLAKLGAMVLARGAGVIRPVQLAAIFASAAANPAYGRLWWRNGGAWLVDIAGARQEGPLVPGAPSDLVLALGAMGRVLGVAPSLGLVVVRLGQQPPDADFRGRFWSLVMDSL